MLKDLHQGEECLPVPIGTVMEQLLPLGDLQFQLFHATPMLLELLAISPTMGWMGFQLSFKLLNGLHLSQNLPGEVVLGRGHVMALGHVPHSKSEATAVLISMAKLSSTPQIRGPQPLHLQTAQFGMQADHCLTGEQKPDVVVGEAKKKRKLTGALALLDDHRRIGSEDHPVLKVPQPMILKEGARVMSLTDGRSKMSKSDPNEGSRITLLDPPELITKKIKRAKTDPERGLEFGNPERPETDNLLSLYAILSGKGREQAAAECADMGWGQFKPLLAEATVAALEPIQARYHLLMEDRKELEQVLKHGRHKAESVANATLSRVRDALGFATPG